MTTPMRLIVGISGASGVAYGIRLLRALNALDVETHLVLTRSAEMTLSYESDLDGPKRCGHSPTPATHRETSARHSPVDRFRTNGMVVAPCSVRSMSEIATGATSTLLTRAADVCLKERRRLVLMVRETPLHLGHLRTMAKLAELGAIIAPAMPALYPRPKTIEDVIDHTVGRLLDLFDIDSGLAYRWRDTVEGSAKIRRLKPGGKSDS